MFLYMVGSGPMFCAFLLCTFLFVHYGRQVHPVPVCSVHVYSVYFYYLCFCHVCFYSGQKRLSAPQGSKKACLPGDGVYRAAERAAERRSSSCRLKACLPGDGVDALLSERTRERRSSSCCLHHKVRRRLACRETGFDALLSERRRGGVQSAVCTTRFEEGLPAGRRGLTRC